MGTPETDPYRKIQEGGDPKRAGDTWDNLMSWIRDAMFMQPGDPMPVWGEPTAPPSAPAGRSDSPFKGDLGAKETPKPGEPGNYSGDIAYDPAAGGDPNALPDGFWSGTNPFDNLYGPPAPGGYTSSAFGGLGASRQTPTGFDGPSVGLPVAGGDWIPGFDYSNYEYPTGWSQGDVWDVLLDPYYYRWDRYGNLHNTGLPGGPVTGAQKLGDDLMAQGNYYQTRDRSDGGWSSSYSPAYYGNLPVRGAVYDSEGNKISGGHRNVDWRDIWHEPGAGRRRRQARRRLWEWRQKKYGIGKYRGQGPQPAPGDGGGDVGGGGDGDIGNQEGLTEWRP